MKTIIHYLLPILFVSIPTALFGQPSISTNEYYHIGDVISMVNCDPGTVVAGAPGAGVTWDFSTLSTSGTYVMTVENDTSSVFTTANVLLRLPTGEKEHILENNTDSHLLGIEDSVSGVVASYYNYDIAKRPITYMTVYVDSYQVAIPATNLGGKGYLTTMGDGYGTLMLPTGTFTNVLRIKEYQTETDSVGSTITSSIKTSYLWFDDAHSAPLLRIDSSISIFGNTNTIMYLVPPTKVANVMKEQANYQCAIRNDELLLSGNFDYGKVYDVAVYNIIGAKIYNTEFTAMNNTAHFVMGADLAPGMYITMIMQKNAPDKKEVIKMIKP